jgi:SRSO17 transposase
MRTPIETPVPALDLVDVQGWRVYWAEIERRLGAVFARSETRTRGMACLVGLLSPAERNNRGQLAASSGDQNPYGFQHLLGRAEWDPDDLRDRLRASVTDDLHAPDAVGVIDETGLLKTGTHSAGVARPYSGTAGRVEKSPIGVFVAYTSRYGHTLLDRARSLPAGWTDDRERCRRAGIPDDRAFATKPALARQMRERTLAAGVVLAWITGDSIYGDDRALRPWLEERRQAYVLAVSGKASVWLQPQQRRISTLLAALPAEGWERSSAGMGRQGPRWDDGLRLEASAPRQGGWQRWVLLRRGSAEPTAVTAYLACAPATTTLAAVGRVAGMRWTVEESIQTAKGEVGLDQDEVRSGTGWYRHRTLARWAQAFLAVVRAETGTDVTPQKGAQGLTKPRWSRFKAHRGLQSDCAGPKFAGCSGNSWLVSSGVRRASCIGRGGAGGTTPGHAITTLASGRGTRHQRTSTEPRPCRQR